MEERGGSGGGAGKGGREEERKKERKEERKKERKEGGQEKLPSSAKGERERRSGRYERRSPLLEGERARSGSGEEETRTGERERGGGAERGGGRGEEPEGRKGPPPRTHLPVLPLSQSDAQPRRRPVSPAVPDPPPPLRKAARGRRPRSSERGRERKPSNSARGADVVRDLRVPCFRNCSPNCSPLASLAGCCVLAPPSRYLDPSSPQLLYRLVGYYPVDLHPVLLLHSPPARHGIAEVPVGREEQQTLALLVQPSHRHHAVGQPRQQLPRQRAQHSLPFLQLPAGTHEELAEVTVRLVEGPDGGRGRGRGRGAGEGERRGRRGGRSVNRREGREQPRSTCAGRLAEADRRARGGGAEGRRPQTVSSRTRQQEREACCHDRCPPHVPHVSGENLKTREKRRRRGREGGREEGGEEGGASG